jgi:hypothetical protein
MDAYIPYYEMKRAYQPILLSFDVDDQIHLWVTNDTPNVISGNIVFKLFNLTTEQFHHQTTLPIEVQASSSISVINLYDIGQIPRVNVLCAWLVDKNGVTLNSSTEFIDIERNMTFKDASLTLTLKNRVLTVTSNHFAHCVELSGNNNGDLFGWIFEDNYFDLLPGMEKKIRIFGNHSQGTISAKAHFSTKPTKIEMRID